MHNVTSIFLSIFIHFPISVTNWLMFIYLSNVISKVFRLMYAHRINLAG